MSGLRASQIKEVIGEIAPYIKGSFIQKIHQPEERTLIIQLHFRGKTHNLCISAHPNNSRIHLTDEKKQNPSTPPGFCQLLRKHIEGSQVKELRQREGDRIVELEVEKHDDSGCHFLTLICELIGTHGNMILVEEGGKILGVTRFQRGPERRLVPGETYSYPPLPPSFSNEDPKSILINFWNEDEEFKWNAAIDKYYQEIEAKESELKFKDYILSLINIEVKKFSGKMKKLREALEETDQWEKLQRYGELIKSHLGVIPRGVDTADVKNYYDPDGKDIRIPLDRKLSPKQNMEKYFKRSRKLRTGKEHIQNEMKDTAEKLESIEKIQNKVKECDQEKDINSLCDLLPPYLKARVQAKVEGEQKKEQKQQQRQPYHSFISKDGLDIFVGKTGKDNDYLTFKVARGNDVWFHTSDYPSSHVIVRISGKEEELPWETLLDAANLTGYFSKAKEHEKISIIYTKRKYVSKPKKAKPGLVTLSTHKNILIKLDEERLKRLLQKE